jgi:hypothetical protein
LTKKSLIDIEDAPTPGVEAHSRRGAQHWAPPPPEGFVSPMIWGVEDSVIERFTAAGVAEERISFERGTWTYNYPGPPSELVTVFRSYYGPTMNAFEAATANGSQAALQAELEALFNEQNTSDDATSLPAPYLRVRVTR